MIKAIIIDDEENARVALSVLIKEHTPEISILGMYESLQEANPAIVKLRPDVVFLDIQMPGETGLELWKYFPQPFFDVVFTTAFSQYAIEAIRLSALDYLLKPIDIDELTRVVDKMTNQQPSKKIEERLLALEKNLTGTQTASQIVLPTLESFIVVKIADILRVESDDNYTRFFLVDGTAHLVSRTLKEYESLLPKPLFQRVHQSHLINLKFVKLYIKGKSGQIEMINGEKLPVSRERKDSLIEALGRV
jgi:two-component system LytT family response regulator